jgi:hypothetical protein
MLTYFILFALLGVLTWFWFDTLRSRELAKNICQQTCQQWQLQLLDDTVALERLGLRRDRRGRLTIQRAYQFEFSVDGSQRQRGIVILRGSTVELLELPGYVARTILPV